MKKKGFTLIELMIVLAIIAILAIVLIPKSGIFKNQSKNSGVITNANTVRAYLETKVSDESGSNSYLSATKLEPILQKAFNLNTTDDSAANPPAVKNAPIATTESGEKLVNPFDKTKAAIIVKDGAYVPSSDDQGKVVVEAYANNYVVYGIDNGGNKTQSFTVK